MTMFVRGFESILAVFKFGGLAPNRLNLNLAVAPQVCLSRSVAVSCLRYLNKATSSQIYKKENWQRAGAELATCTVV